MYLTDIGREIIIYILLCYLIYNTKINILRIIFTIVLIFHIYKFINNFKVIYNFTINNIPIFIVIFLILLYFLKLLIKKKDINTFILFFILFRILSSYLSNYKRIKPLYPNYYNIIYSIISLSIYFIYNNYKFRNIFMASFINHLLLYINI